MEMQEASRIVEKYLDEIRKTCPVEIEVNYSITEEFTFGYVFYYNSKEFWQTKDFSKSLAGNGPLLVKRETGELQVLPSNRAVKKSLAELGLLG